MTTDAKTPTPRTDAEVNWKDGVEVEMIEHNTLTRRLFNKSRQLESELAELREQLATIKEKNAPEIAKVNEYLEGQRLRIMADTKTIESMREQLAAAEQKRVEAIE